jgi:hypothetical protein
VFFMSRSFFHLLCACFSVFSPLPLLLIVSLMSFTFVCAIWWV